MLRFSAYITENYKNFIGPTSTEDRKKWVDQAWDLLQTAYAPMGGMKGGGFASKEDMIHNLPMWKLFVRGDRLVAATFYKDKNGRKAVAIASDGSPEGKKIVADRYKADMKVSYGEKSGPALGFAIKTIGMDVIQNFVLKPELVQKLTGDKNISVTKYGVDNLDPKDRITFDKYPELKDYFYVREIGGEMHLKLTFGAPGLTIRG